MFGDKRLAPTWAVPGFLGAKIKFHTKNIKFTSFVTFLQQEAQQRCDTFSLTVSQKWFKNEMAENVTTNIGTLNLPILAQSVHFWTKIDILKTHFYVSKGTFSAIFLERKLESFLEFQQKVFGRVVKLHSTCPKEHYGIRFPTNFQSCKFFGLGARNILILTGFFRQGRQNYLSRGTTCPEELGEEVSKFTSFQGFLDF